MNDRSEDETPPTLGSGMRRALIEGKEELLRDESDAWLRANLPKFALMAEQLRNEAKKRCEEERPHLRLAAHFEDLAMDPSRPPHLNSDDDAH